MPIHPTAIIGINKEDIDPSNEIGAYVVIEDGVQLGKNNRIMAHAFLGKGTVIGDNNIIHVGAVLGDVPQDIKFDVNLKTQLIIGNNNTFREHFTAHRSTNVDHPTQIGDNGFFMVSSHVAHDCVVGNNVIMANSSAIAGHVHVHDRAFISGGVMIHQFVQVGSLSIIAGNARINMDVPPFVIAGERNQVWGINIVGLRRSGLSPEIIKEIRELYRLYFHTSRKDVVERIKAKDFKSKEIQVFLDFIENSKRGICVARSSSIV